MKFIISKITRKFQANFKLKVLYHLEDKLQELYTKAMTLKQLRSQSNSLEDGVLIKLLEYARIHFDKLIILTNFFRNSLA